MLNKTKIKYIQSLSHKKQRDQDSVFVAEGPKIIKELLDEKNIKLKELFATKEFLNLNPGIVSQQAFAITEISEDELRKISFLSTPKQVLGIFQKPAFPEFSRPEGITIVLETIQDPGNMGTIIRCSDWFGIKNIICSKDSVDIFNPKVVQSTMGSIGRVQVIYCDPVELLNNFSNIPVLAATLKGRPVSSIKTPSNCFLIIGNESKGISKPLLEKVNTEITIPGRGKAESLNAGVATGIILSWLTNEPI